MGNLDGVGLADRHGHVVAGMNVNAWDATEPIRALIQSGEQIDATRLSDPAIPLSQLLRC